MGLQRIRHDLVTEQQQEESSCQWLFNCCDFSCRRRWALVLWLCRLNHSLLKWFYFFKFLLNLLQYCYCFLFCCFGPQACGILAPQPGVKPISPALEGEVSPTGPPRNSPEVLLICQNFHIFFTYFIVESFRLTGFYLYYILKMPINFHWFR